MCLLGRELKIALLDCNKQCVLRINVETYAICMFLILLTVSAGYQYQQCVTVFWMTQTTTLSGYDISSSDIGGWNLNIHHTYNFQEGRRPDCAIICLNVVGQNVCDQLLVTD